MAANTEPVAADAATPASGWIEERTQGRALAAALLHVRIPAEARTLYFGGIALFLFGIQVATGTLLALYYKPTPDAAYDSVLFMMSDVSFGWLIRSVHHWAANLMILFVVLHLLRVFFQAAYKYPRELTWVIGIGLLGITMVFGFTGYLLPWDQRAYWATVVGTEIAGSVPLIGDQLLLLLRGGVDVTEATLSRFFGLHVLVLPLVLGGLLAVHLTLVHQLGLANPKRPDPRGRPPEGKTVPFFPNYVLDELIAWYILLALLVVLASLFPAGLEAQANPLETPPHTKPEWYFLGVYELLKLVPRIVGILAPIGGLFLLTVLPFLDRNPEVLARRRKLAVGTATVVLVAGIALTVRGFSS
ncbi:MAG: cytochrome bc complex cytochrome b subunit [Chloroflexi bacterium]|nr:cytochrome bc complex cytochrome b subunit [Chloroflexota bacterium]